MADDLLRVRIDASRNGNQIDLTVAELGVLLTALNRSLNKLAVDPSRPAPLIPELAYRPLSAEPVSVQLRITSIRRGSVELQAIIDLLADTGLDRETAKSILLGILANALFDPNRTQTLINDFGRALQRVAQGALGKVISITIAIGQVAGRIRSEISDAGKTRVTAERVPADDIQ